MIQGAPCSFVKYDIVRLASDAINSQIFYSLLHTSSMGLFTEGNHL